ncbi:MAG: NAD(P)H-hydrate dehydratase [Candidatus Aenigmarchaeota archaeon]|nr:NAD(P)H-hydrate dehydratase [Candidatus Aenigmarchaeota archaeon]
MLVSSAIVRNVYKKREAWSHKGQFGRLLVVGGSRLYSGSPAFNAMAAYRAGCDLVTIAAPERAANIAASFEPDIIAYPLKGNYIEKKHVKEIRKVMKTSSAMVIGGGISKEKKTLSAVAAILKDSKIPTVVDADGLYAVKKKLGRKFLLTPHSHEFFVLGGGKPSRFVNERLGKTKTLAARLGCTVLLKGHIDTISDGTQVATSATGNPYMTKGGMGDTLAGICGALLARGASTFDAACCAAYINGLAGDIASKTFHEGLTASDMLWSIPKAIEQAKK